MTDSSFRLLFQALTQKAGCALGNHQPIFKSAVCGHLGVCLACRRHPNGEDCS